MDLINYIGLKVKIILTNNYYFIGKVTNADEEGLDMIDINHKKVSLKQSSILTIQEVDEWNNGFVPIVKEEKKQKIM